MDMLATAIGLGVPVRPAAKGGEAPPGLSAAEGESAADAGAFSDLVPRDAAGAEDRGAPVGKGEAGGEAPEKEAGPPDDAAAPGIAAAATAPLAPATVLGLATAAPAVEAPPIEGAGSDEARVAIEPPATAQEAPAQVQTAAPALPTAKAAPMFSGGKGSQPVAQTTAPSGLGVADTGAPAASPGLEAPAVEPVRGEAERSAPETAPVLVAPGAGKEAAKEAAKEFGKTPSPDPATGPTDTAAPVMTGGSGAERDGSRDEQPRSDRGLTIEERGEAGAKADRTPTFAPAGQKAETPAAAPNPGQAMAAAGVDAAAPEGAVAAPRLDGAPPADAAAAPQGATAPPSHAAAARLAPHLQVGQQIVRRFDGGAMSIDLRLDPPELGQVSVKLDVSPDGAVKAAIGADTPAALAELVRGARELERALSQAGLSVDRGALTFDLHDRSGGGAGRQDRQDRPGGSGPGFTDPTAPPAPVLTASLWRAARVDMIA